MTVKLNTSAITKFVVFQTDFFTQKPRKSWLCHHLLAGARRPH